MNKKYAFCCLIAIVIACSVFAYNEKRWIGSYKDGETAHFKDLTRKNWDFARYYDLPSDTTVYTFFEDNDIYSYDKDFVLYSTMSVIVYYRNGKIVDYIQYPRSSEDSPLFLASDGITELRCFELTKEQAEFTVSIRDCEYINLVSGESYVGKKAYWILGT